MRCKIFGRGVCLVSLSIALTLQAIAQDDVDTDEKGMGDNRADDIVSVYDHIKRASDLPLSVEVLSSDDLETVQLTHPSEGLNRVSGVNIHRGSGQEHLTAIRSPVLTGGAGAGSFLYLEDGVPLRAAGFANVNGLFEAGTEFAGAIDVFKGPGPATYGSNAVHGLINVSSQRIGEGGSRFSIMASEDGYGRLTNSTAFKGLNGDMMASFSFTHDDGFRDQSGFDQQKMQLKYDGKINDIWSVEWLTSFQNLNQETAGFIQGMDAYKDDTIRFTNPNPEAFRDAKSYRTQARFARSVGNYDVAITPYIRRTELRFLRHFVPGQALEKNVHTSAGFQSAYYSDSKNGFNVGIDAEYTEGTVYEFQANPNRFSFVQGLHYDYGVKALVGAAYGQKQFDLKNSLALNIGARAEYTRYDYNNNASTGRSGRFIRAADRKDDFFTLTPKVSLTYAANEHFNLYTRAARGSRAPQITDLYSAQINQIPGEADVETLDSLEAGMKYNDDTYRFSGSVFTMWKDNFFFRNANGFNVVNGKTRHSGIEVALDIDISSKLSVSGGGTLARHTYDFNEIVGSAANNIIDGNRVDTAPDTLAQMRAAYAFSDSFDAEIEWRHMGSYFTNPGNTVKYSGHDIFILRAAYNFSDNLTVFGRADNVLDTRYADRADFAFGNERYFPGRPRTLFIGVTRKY